MIPAPGLSTSSAGVLLWDIDGTLVRVTASRQDKHLAAAEAVLGTRIEAPPSWTGRTDAEILRGLCLAGGTDFTSQVRLDMTVELNRLTDIELQAIPTTPAPGVLVALAATSALGWVNGVVTGNTRGRALAKLESSGLANLVDWGHAYFGDDVDSREVLVRQAIADLRRQLVDRLVVVVGDTPRDITAAQTADVPVIAVATGVYETAVLAALTPDLMLVDLDAGHGQLVAFLSTNDRT